MINTKTRNTKSIVFLCLHNGLDHKPSRNILELLNKVNLLNIIIPIQIDDDDTKFLIQNNTKNIYIEKLPAFIIVINTLSHYIYYDEDIDNVIELANEINQNI